MLSSRRGFSLIELMIVVAIVSVVAAITVPRFLKHQMRLRQGLKGPSAETQP